MFWEIDSVILIKLLLSAALGGTIGLEREVHGRPAGFRTHLLVSLGSALFVISSIHFYSRYGNMSGTVAVGVDPGRVAAQVVTGIGFLGAGAIIRERTSIRGLTTAACLWIAAAIGLSCGIGMFGAALAVTALSLMSLLLLKKIEARLPRDSYERIKVWSNDIEGQKARIEEMMKEYRLQIVSLSMEKDMEKSGIQFEFEIKLHTKGLPCLLVDRISTIPGVCKVRLN